MSLLEVKNLTVWYGTLRALDSVSFHVDDGELVAMIGPNGAGKSTAFKAVSGLIRQDGRADGDVTFAGQRINGLEPYQLVQRGLCLVPEGRRVLGTMSVLENLEMGAYTLSDEKTTAGALNRVFALFPRLKERQRQRAGTLSSGEQQMLAIGRALMLEPKLLLLDEPSLGLSPNYVYEVFEKLKEVNRAGMAVLLVEQNARMALQYSDRAYVFGVGTIAFEGQSKELLRDERVKKSFLGASSA